MKIHEYQGKQVLAEYGVTVPRGHVAFTVDEAVAAAESLGGSVWVVKAQIHAGGRGKGGGVKLARSLEEVRSLSEEILGMTLVTHQTGPSGQLVRRIYIEEGADIAQELYLGVVLDRDKNRICFMASTEGGTEIEVVAEEQPEKILKEWVDPAVGLAGYQARNLAYGLGLEGGTVAGRSTCSCAAGRAMLRGRVASCAPCGATIRAPAWAPRSGQRWSSSSARSCAARSWIGRWRR